MSQGRVFLGKVSRGRVLYSPKNRILIFRLSYHLLIRKNILKVPINKLMIALVLR